MPRTTSDGATAAGPLTGRDDGAAMDVPSSPSSETLCVLVLAPTGRDASLLLEALAVAGIEAEAVGSADELTARIVEEIDPGKPSRLGALLVTDEAMAVEWSARLVEVLDRQASWSDLPIVLLAGHAGLIGPDGERRWVGSTAAGVVGERLMSRGSVTVLDRPVRVATLVSAVRAALRARARQLEVRELIDAHARAQADAERANRAKSDFLAVMSHELRTPLNAIAGHVQLIDLGIYGPVTGEQREALARVDRAQRHLLGVINDLLNFARLESGRVEYEIQPVSLAEVMTEAGPMFEPQIAGRGLTYEVRMPAPELRVLADRDKLRQILINLLSNACKFTRAGGRITMEVAERADGTQPEDVVFLRVTDTGVGIPADKLETVFEPFVQVRAGDIAREGTGLGLAISRDLARGMGGELRARSEEGKGSTFSVELRRAPG